MRVLQNRVPVNTLPAGHNSRIDSGEDMVFHYCQAAGSVLAAGAGSSTAAWLVGSFRLEWSRVVQWKEVEWTDEITPEVLEESGVAMSEAVEESDEAEALGESDGAKLEAPEETGALCSLDSTEALEWNGAAELTEEVGLNDELGRTEAVEWTEVLGPEAQTWTEVSKQ